MKYYIHDTTIGNKYVYFNTVNELVNYFNVLIPRKHKVSKSSYVQHLLELGHGYEDQDGVMLTRALAEQFNIGVVRNNNQHERTDIHEASRFLKEEYGN